MKTRKFFMMAIIFAMTALTIACSKEDDAKTVVIYPDEPTHTGPASINMRYTVKVSPDMLAYLDMTVDYIGLDGEVNHLTLANVMHDTVLTWQTTLSTPLPATFGMRLNGQLKPGVDTADIPGTRFRMERSLFYAYSLIDSNNVTIKTQSITNPKGLDVPKRNLVKYLEEHSENGIIANGVVFDAQGNVTEKSSWPL